MIIRRARLNELAELRHFYNTHWGYKHAIINIKTYVDFYFIDGEYLNFIIARYTEDSEIISACGYVLSNSTGSPDVWTTLWLTKRGVVESIGLQIVDFMANKMGFRSLSTNKAEQNTLILYRFLGYETAVMDHYYRLSDKSSYSVAIIERRVILPYEATGYSLVQLKEPQQLLDMFDDSILANNVPHKDLNYIIKRYYEFPFYYYYVYGILDEQRHCRSIVVIRKVEINYTSVLRVVDLIGNYEDFAQIGHCVQDLLNKFGCEYIDFYCYGLPPEILNRAGFLKRTGTDVNIIPGYLEPYVPKNIEYYFFCNRMDGFTMFKADGDQDRLYIDIL